MDLAISVFQHWQKCQGEYIVKVIDESTGFGLVHESPPAKASLFLRPLSTPSVREQGKEARTRAVAIADLACQRALAAWFNRLIRTLFFMVSERT